MMASGNYRKNNKQCMTYTADVSGVLKSLNQNTAWKNHTNELLKTFMGNTNNPQPNIMSEAELDQLFKVKPKINIKTQNKNETWNNNHPQKTKNPDYVKKVKFLDLDDEWDRLLTGLPDNDSLDSDRISQMFNDDADEEQAVKKKDLTHEFKKNFLVGKIVGEGAYACVRVAVYKPNNQKVAIKVYQKTKLKELQRKKSVRREIRILQTIDQPNIVKIMDVVETNNHLNIIMEYLPGISLNSYLKNQNGYKATEKNCKAIFKPLFEALRYLHAKSIAHRDIKLENIILDENLNPKLIDFGFSTCIEPTKKVKIFCGTPSYMAPEIVQKKQYRGETADIWAIGVLLFVALTGIFPFKGSTDQELYRKINHAEYNRELLPSKDSLDLLAKMLKINPDDRIKACEILKHPWLNKRSHTNGSARKQMKRIDSVEQKKRTTISTHKSKEDTWAGSNAKRLTETCKQNLKMELRLARQSPRNACKNRMRQQGHYLNATHKFLKTEKFGNRKREKTHKQQKENLKENRQTVSKNTSKVLDLLKLEMRRRYEDKSKGKLKRL